MKPKAAVQRFYYDVFGSTMRADRVSGQWQLFRVSAEGKSSRVGDISIPDDMQEVELITFLDDMFHEYASPTNNRVKKRR
ncbi:MAG: hypothetical protein KJN90_02940 [Gammaproteobacteria bacterium]|nr:hypothetical protein [Gammaproteobacteria bacterium]